ncbi:MAG: hypothetical protein ACODAJ_14580 [Planctomycetota bacterium]
MRTASAVVLAALLAIPAAWADVVSMPDKIELSGKKIEILEIRDDEIVVRVAYGEITVPRQRVEEMEVDFKTRLQRLKDEAKDTAGALCRLGRVCHRLDMKEEAETAYRQALARPRVPEDILLPMASDLEALGAWDAAHKSYQAYLKLHPDNADVQARARAAAAKAADMEPELQPVAVAAPDIEITPANPVTVKPAAEEPAEPHPEEPGEPQPEKPAEPEEPEQPDEGDEPKVVEGLEARAGWTTEAWGSSAEITVGAAKGQDNKMLRVWLAGKEKDKVNVMLEKDFDLSKKKALNFDMYNFSQKRIDVAVAFINRPGWKFYESLPKTVLPTGDTPKQITVDLTSNRWKSADTKWRHKTALLNPDKIIKMYFLLYTDVTGEWVFFDNVRFDPPDPPPAAGGPAPAEDPDAEAARAQRLERVARFMLRNAQASVEKGDWAKAKRFLDRLGERYADTEFIQEQKDTIEALVAKTKAGLAEQGEAKKVPPAEAQPEEAEPEQAEPEPAEPKEAEPEAPAKPDQPEKAPKPEQPEKADEPQKAEEPEPAEPEPAPEEEPEEEW